ncbi:hypothetical protein [Mycobacterium sp.]|uniref:hypothetical protein n=1 Tax=Mycobacterium sp. TaxID=1785 RepID=UPI003F9E644E
MVSLADSLWHRNRVLAEDAAFLDAFSRAYAFGVCNYLTTHTEQASGGIESLALLGEQQGMGPSKSQGIIQQAVTNVCPWNQSTFAKHVMTDTSNF